MGVARRRLATGERSLTLLFALLLGSSFSSASHDAEECGGCCLGIEGWCDVVCCVDVGSE